MGYLLIDNRESNGRLEEFDTKGCKHCNAVMKVFRPPYTHTCNEVCHKYGCDHIQGYCWRCDGVICPHCCLIAQKVVGCIIYRREAEKLVRAINVRRNLERLFGI